MVPRFAKFFYPVLKFLSNDEIETIKSTISYIKTYFNLSETDCAQKVRSGRTTQVYDRVQWTMQYLKAAELISSPQRGHYKITQKGIEVIKSGITDLNNPYLCNISENFKFFIKRKDSESSENHSNDNSNEGNELSPSESIDELIAQLNSSLASELLEQIKNQTPQFFEQLVLDLLVKMGYGGNREDAAMVTKISHDGGIDGIIKEDRLGLDKIYIQAKRWENTVQKPEIQKFRGALSEKGANKGIFITTSDFSNGAKESAHNAKIVLIDGEELCKLMIEYGVGVTVRTTYEVKRIDTDYFISE